MEDGNSSRRSKRLRPQIYVHVEFGVSWSEQRVPTSHEVTYRSKGLRERMPNFPRQVPAPNTNFLTASQASPQQSHIPPRWESLNHYWDHHHHYPPLGHSHPQQPPQQRSRQVAFSPEEDPDRLRTSRSGSRSSNERRGRSAPPPFGNNPWDVDVNADAQLAAEPSATTAGPSSTRTPATATGLTRINTDPGKALPEVPSRFRLGEDGMPWSSWSLPMGYDPDAYPLSDDEDGSRGGGNISAATATNASGHRRRPSSQAFVATSPTAVSVFSPGPTGEGFRMRAGEGQDPRTREMTELSAAMVTVDNGFENQWWYQGRRETTSTDGGATTSGATVTNVSPAATTMAPLRPSGRSIGWAVARPDERLSLATAVSPVGTELTVPMAIGSPRSFYPMARTWSTRSEELFLTGRGGSSPLPAYTTADRYC